MAELEVQDGQRILFVGDSITGCGRLKEGANPLGNSYVRLFSELLIARYPERNVQVINRGVGGDCIVDLRKRWHEDVLSLEPDWLGIAIGINDVHSYLFEGQLRESLEVFQEVFELLLRSLPAALHGKILLLDPFYLRQATSAQGREGQVLEALPRFIDVVHSMRAWHETRLVATHTVFQKHLELREPPAFSADPVHPNELGHLIIAEEVVRALSA